MCFPGQRQAAQWWGDQIRNDLLEFGLQSMSGFVWKCRHVPDHHMDDLMIASDLISVLESKYKLTKCGPISEEVEPVRFLKKKLTICRVLQSA